MVVKLANSGQISCAGQTAVCLAAGGGGLVLPPVPQKVRERREGALERAVGRRPQRRAHAGKRSNDGQIMVK